MSAVEALATAFESPQPVEVGPTGTAPETTAPAEPSIDSQLEALWDRDQVNNGADRDTNGKFKSPNPDKVAEALNKAPEEAKESVLEGAETGEAAEGDGSTLSPTVPLPANWNGKDEVWSKVPDDIKPVVAEIQADLQNRLTSQGREIANAKPITDAVNDFRHLFEGRIDPAEGIRKLAMAQQNLENPNTRLHALMSIIDSFGARDNIAALLTGQAQLPAAPQRPSISVQDVDRVVEKRLAEDRATRESQEELSRLSTGKPLYAEIPPQTMVHFINAAWSVLGEGASKEAVFNQAYDMATDSIPALKAKKQAAAKPAVVPKPVSPEAAKRANSVNVTSTSSGKIKEASEDEQLDAIWERNQRG